MRKHTMKSTFEEGREAQFQEMMQHLTLLQSKYKGVRGELLAKVAEELARLKPSASTSTTIATVTLPVAAPARAVAAPPSPVLSRVEAPIPAIRVASASSETMLPSCRMCGRTMRRNDADGSLVCAKGHTRPPARVAQPEGESATQ
jgi:hypothetical protein